MNFIEADQETLEKESDLPISPMEPIPFLVLATLQGCFQDY